MCRKGIDVALTAERLLWPPLIRMRESFVSKAKLWPLFAWQRQRYMALPSSVQVYRSSTDLPG